MWPVNATTSAAGTSRSIAAASGSTRASSTSCRRIVATLPASPAASACAVGIVLARLVAMPQEQRGFAGGDLIPAGRSGRRGRRGCCTGPGRRLCRGTRARRQLRREAPGDGLREPPCRRAVAEQHRQGRCVDARVRVVQQRPRGEVLVAGAPGGRRRVGLVRRAVEQVLPQPAAQAEDVRQQRRRIRRGRLRAIENWASLVAPARAWASAPQ